MNIRHILIISMSLVGGFVIYNVTKSATASTNYIITKPNEYFTITIPANATTGYQWYISSITNADNIQVISDTYKPDPAPEGVTGHGGNAIFMLKAQQSGTSEITFEYRRAWEEQPAERITYTIEIQ